MKDTNITFKLSESEKNAIRELAEKLDVPMSQIIREACKKYIQEVS